MRPATVTTVRCASNDFWRDLSEFLAHFCKRVRSDKLVRVCLLAECGNLAQLVLAECKEVALEFRLKQWVPLPRIIAAGDKVQSHG